MPIENDVSFQLIISFNISSEPYEPKPVLGATLAAVRGYSTPMDLVRVETKNEVPRLQMNWIE